MNVAVASNVSTTSSSMQTSLVDLFMLMDMLNQLPEEFHLPVLSELFSIFYLPSSHYQFQKISYVLQQVPWSNYQMVDGQMYHIALVKE